GGDRGGRVVDDEVGDAGPVGQAARGAHHGVAGAGVAGRVGRRVVVAEARGQGVGDGEARAVRRAVVVDRDPVLARRAGDDRVEVVAVRTDGPLVELGDAEVGVADDRGGLVRAV